MFHIQCLCKTAADHVDLIYFRILATGKLTKAVVMGMIYHDVYYEPAVPYT